MTKLSNMKIGVIGLGYVGLPLAVEFGKKYPVIGFDIEQKRIKQLKKGVDLTQEITHDDLEKSVHLSFTTSIDDLSKCNVFIVTVPTPIDEGKNPDLSALAESSQKIGIILKKGDLVIYESTVYPGATEEFCVPLLERQSGLKLNKDFFVGYSPERINPGDKSRSLSEIVKVTSGSSKMSAKIIDNLYASIIKAGTFRASSIRVAEAAKVIENTQRDINIALINELSIIFNKMNIDTESVLKAAETKWNFLSFRPGLVGGHCIGVDPYYLKYKAESIGHHPMIISAGRRVNDEMGSNVGKQLVKKMLKRSIQVWGSKVLIMGFTFKENCPDVRNTRVIDVIKELKEFGVKVDLFDPWVHSQEATREYEINLIKKPQKKKYEGIIVAVAHDEFKVMGARKIREFGKDNHILFDLKFIFSRRDSDLRL